MKDTRTPGFHGTSEDMKSHICAQSDSYTHGGFAQVDYLSEVLQDFYPGYFLKYETYSGCIIIRSAIVILVRAR
jgi:hypothetical protein